MAAGWHLMVCIISLKSFLNTSALNYPHMVIPSKTTITRQLLKQKSHNYLKQHHSPRRRGIKWRHPIPNSPVSESTGLILSQVLRGCLRHNGCSAFTSLQEPTTRNQNGPLTKWVLICIYYICCVHMIHKILYMWHILYKMIYFIYK